MVDNKNKSNFVFVFLIYLFNNKDLHPQQINLME